MKKTLIALAVAIALTGCGKVDRAVATWTGSSSTCVEGLKVVQMTSGAFYQRTPDDKLIPCK